MKKTNFIQIMSRDLKRNYILYLMIFPVLVYYITFYYVPMYGVQIAFRDYIPKLGFFKSEWVGWYNFSRFFDGYNFWNLIKNTVGISIYSLVVGFPIPIIFALMLNYINKEWFKKSIQMISYAPYFISIVVICGMITIFMSPDAGILNIIREEMGLEPVAFLSKAEWFKSIYVWTGIWQGIGWASIIYISALSGVDPQLHEAAIIDGAIKIKRIYHIDLPSIAPTIIMLFILNVGQIMNVGFEKIFLLQNSLNMSASDVISTYVYRVGLIGADYSFSTAVGLFNSVINLIILIMVNQAAKKMTSTSLW